MLPKGRKDSRVAIILNKETTTFSCLEESSFSENKMEYLLETSFLVTDKKRCQEWQFWKIPLNWCGRF